MWKQISIISALTLALSATTALVQHSPATAQAINPGGSSDEPLPAELLADPTGANVYSSDGQKVGEVAAARINPALDQESIQKYDTIWVNMGGFLGIGDKTVKLSADQFTRDSVDGQIKLNLTAAQVSRLPHSEPR